VIGKIKERNGKKNSNSDKKYLLDYLAAKCKRVSPLTSSVFKGG